VRAFLERQAANEPAPPDWCYVYDFADARRPRALRLPAGRGRLLRQDLRELVDELKAAIPAIFESEDYRTRRKLVETRFTDQSERTFGALEERARQRGVAILRTQSGVASPRCATGR